jgi:hypothetical protein
MIRVLVAAAKNLKSVAELNMECTSCLKPKANLKCGVCANALCKSCAQFLEDDQFKFLGEVPADLSHEVYCPGCFDSQVAPQMADYESKLEKARKVYVFYKAQGKETRLFSRAAGTIKVTHCADEDEAMLWLAFKAVQGGYNAVIDIEMNSKKTKDGSYSLVDWTGSGIPTQVDGERLDRKVEPKQ